MRIEKVNYQKIFSTGMQFLNHKIGVEIQLDETDDPNKAFQLAKEYVEKMNLESNPGYAAALEQSSTTEKTEEQPLARISNDDKKQQTIQSHIKTINECQTLKNLEIFKKMVERTNDPDLNNAYNQKWKTFQE